MSLLRYEDGFVEDAEYNFEPDTIAKICGSEINPQTDEYYFDILRGGTDILILNNNCFVKTNETPEFEPTRTGYKIKGIKELFTVEDKAIIDEFYDFDIYEENRDITELTNGYRDLIEIATTVKHTAEKCLELLTLKKFDNEQFPSLPSLSRETIQMKEIAEHVTSYELDVLTGNGYLDRDYIEPISMKKLEQLINLAKKEMKHKKIRAALSSSDYHVAESLRDRIYRNLND